MMGRAVILILTLLWLPSPGARKATGLSAKGIEHLKNGQYTRSRKVLSEALKKTLVSGREDWVIKATLNLADLELTAFNLNSAKEYLSSLPTSDDPELRAVVAWKKAQLAFYQGREGVYQSHISKALNYCEEEYDICPYIWLDSYRMEVKKEKIANIKTKWEAFLDGSGKQIKNNSADIKALILMREKNFEAANKEWDHAIEMYREAGRLPAMAHCQNKKALSLMALERYEEALELNRQAIMVFNAMGLKIRSLQCQVLQLFFPESYLLMDKIQNNLDIVGLKIDDWEIEFALKNYQYLAPVILSVDINNP